MSSLLNYSRFLFNKMGGDKEYCCNKFRGPVMGVAAVGKVINRGPVIPIQCHILVTLNKHLWFIF